MKRHLFPALVIIVLAAAVVAAQERVTPDESGSARYATRPAARFTWLDVLVDSGEAPLAAYQVEFFATEGDVLIAGIEGGEHPAFAEPPYYDTRALQNDRAILAAFNTGDDLPSGRTRVARIHVMITGADEPAYELTLRVAASADSKEIPASVVLGQGEEK